MGPKVGGTHQASNLTVVSGSPLKTGTQLETRDCEYGIAWDMILLESKIQKTILLHIAGPVCNAGEKVDSAQV